MDTLKVLLAGDDGLINDFIEQFVDQEHSHLDYTQTSGEDDTLEYIVTHNPDLCFIRQSDETLTVAGIQTSLNEAGLKTTIIGIIDKSLEKQETSLAELGVQGVILANDDAGSSVRMMLRYMISIKHQQIKFRDEKERMISQFIDLQDVHERTEQQSVNLVDMAEDLASTKEQLETLNQEKDKFFSIIAHDLRSPFTSIMGYTELLAGMADTLKPEQVKNYSDSVHEAAQNVFRLLENLLNWARMEQGHMTFDPQPHQLNDTSAQAIQPLLSVAEEKDIQINNNLDGKISFYDNNMIETVIRNLVNNAIKFTDNGSITINCDDLGAQYRINVQDTGLGMTQKMAKDVFSIAVNTSTKGTAGEKGSGLGLILCKELVEKNGGFISVISEPGHGSTFSFTLPKQTNNK